MTTPSDVPVRLDVWADIACPWCYIGSRHLGAALEEERAAGREVVVRHRPFELQPAMPPDGVPMKAFFEARFGGPDAVQGMFDRVTEVGRSVGIDFDFDAMPKAPNTRLAHAAVLSYDGDPRQRDVLLRLYAAYFEQGLDITDREVVVAVVAEASGDAAEEVAARLVDTGALDDDLSVARALGVDAVPLFVADAGDASGDELGLSAAAIAVSGAQPARTLTHLLDQARTRASA
ncbi:MAG: DsbA family oxidoreductase [Candidatus Nanopelagicales bacterium]